MPKSSELTAPNDCSTGQLEERINRGVFRSQASKMKLFVNIAQGWKLWKKKTLYKTRGEI